MLASLTVKNGVARVLLGTSVGLYTACLTLPGYGDVSSIAALLTGWAVAFLPWCSSWLANPALFVAWGLILAKTSKRLPISLSALSFGLAFAFPILKQFNPVGLGESLPDGPVHDGYWLWLSSTVPAFTATLIFDPKARRKLRPPPFQLT